MSLSEENDPNSLDPFARPQEQDDFREIDLDLLKDAEKQLRFFAIICQLAAFLCFVGWIVGPTLAYTALGITPGGADPCIWFFTFCGGLVGGVCLLQLAKELRAQNGVTHIQNKLRGCR